MVYDREDEMDELMKKKERTMSLNIPYLLNNQIVEYLSFALQKCMTCQPCKLLQV